MVSKSLFGQSFVFLKFFAVLLGLVALDLISKSFAPGVIDNPGFFLGLFSEGSSFYRVFCTAAVLGIFALASGLIQFLYAKTEPALNRALILFQAGVLGNAIDKLSRGSVRDFIPLSFFNSKLTINIADLYLWTSLVLFLLWIWKKPTKVSLRGQYLVYPKTQLRFVTLMLLIVAFLLLGMGLLFFAYLKASGVQFFPSELGVVGVLFSLFALVLVGVFSVIWSHRVYGPLKAIGRYLEMSEEVSRERPFRLRASDENECTRDLIQKIDQRLSRQ